MGVGPLALALLGFGIGCGDDGGAADTSVDTGVADSAPTDSSTDAIDSMVPDAGPPITHAWDVPVVESAPHAKLSVDGEDRILLAVTDGREGHVLRFASDGTQELDHTFPRFTGFVFGVQELPDGDLLVNGTINLASDFGGGERTVPDFEPLHFVVRLGPDGSYRWDYTHKSGPGTVVRATTDAIWVAGTFDGTADFGGGMRTADALGSGFLLELTTAGAYTNDEIFPRALPADLSVDATGRTLVGTMNGDHDFGGGVRGASEASPAGFVARFRSDGAYEWDVTWTDTSTKRMAVEPGGNIFVQGRLLAATDFGGGMREPLSAPMMSYSTHYVVALDSAGAYRWDSVWWAGASTAVDSRGVRFDAEYLAVDSMGQVFVAGNVGGSRGVVPTLELAGASRSGAGALLLALGSDGAYRWDWYISDGDDGNPVSFTDLVIDSTDDLVLLGFTTGRDFGGGLRSEGAFVLKVREGR